MQSVIENAIPDSFVGLTLQHNPVMPMVSRWSQPIPDGMLDSKPIEEYLAAHPRSKFVQVSDVFRESELLKSDFYRRYMAPSKVALWHRNVFWNGPEVDLRGRDHAQRKNRAI